MVPSSWLPSSWSTQKMPGDRFLPAQLRLSAWLRAEEGTFQRSIFSPGSLTDLEREGTSPEAELGKRRASIHPVPLPKRSWPGRKPLLAEVSKLLARLPRLPLPRHLSAPLQSTLPIFGPHIPAWQEPDPAQLGRRCPHVPTAAGSHPHCPRPARAKFAPETRLWVTD